MNIEIAAIRKDYRLKSLNENEVAAHPIHQFTLWWQEAINSNIDEVNAMTLATATADGKPSARIVLLKGYDEAGFTFFTNYNSSKGEMLQKNPLAALVFFWKELERQVRIEGTVEKLSEQESDAYFQSRPLSSRIGAWSSPQSTIIANRTILEENEKKYQLQFGEQVPKPPHWGGYRVKPTLIEFWQGRSSRLHDRIEYELTIDGMWKTQRLAP